MSHWSAAPMDRNQVVLFAPTLDQSLADDHPVRLFAETLAAFDFADWERMYVRSVGRPAADPPAGAGRVHPLRAVAGDPLQPPAGGRGGQPAGLHLAAGGAGAGPRDDLQVPHGVRA